MMGLFRKKKGNVLVIAVAAVIALFLCAILVLETGNFMFHKAHLQNVADAGAMEGGIWYARGLNVASLSNVILAGSAVVAVFFPQSAKFIDYVQKAQDFLLAGMPWLVSGMVVKNGAMNGIISIPLFNVSDGMNYLPSLNVERQYLEEMVTEAVKYYYVDGETGRKNYVPEENVRYNSKAKRFQLRSGEKKYFVRREVKIKSSENKDGGGLLKGFIVESGDHSILVIASKDGIKPVYGGELLKDQNGKKIEQAAVFGTSLVRISGGNVEVKLDRLAGATFEAKIEHVEVPKIPNKQLNDLVAKYKGKFLPDLAGKIIVH